MVDMVLLRHDVGPQSSAGLFLLCEDSAELKAISRLKMRTSGVALIVLCALQNISDSKKKPAEM